MDILNILWDVDGTLFDTYPAIIYAISKSLNEMGLSIAFNVIDGLARQSLDHCVETLSQRFKRNPGLLRRQFAESYRTIPPANQPPFPGVGELCAYIHTHGGLNVAVTHLSVQSTQALLEAHRLAPFFNDILSVEQGYPRKPSPAMVLAVLEKHAMNPTETLLIGDRDLDIQAGRAAGVRTCVFGQAELTTPADFQIGHYSQLLSLLQDADQ
jgi:HAD superfamily hydrolase (TIGR01509 family)